jgi:Tol biopolymer transport system component
MAETIETIAPKRKGAWKNWKMLASLATFVLLSAAAYWWSRPDQQLAVSTYTQLTHDGLRKLGPILTDGTRLYFRERVAGEKISVAQLSTSGGETALLSIPFENIALWDIAPDHSRLLVSNFRGLEPELALWTLPLPAGNPRRIGEMVGHDAAWSADGQRIVYAYGKDLYVAGEDGTNKRKIVTAAGLASSPRWSPDGKVIRFTLSQTPNSASIWEVAGNGTNLHAILPTWQAAPFHCCGTWTPNGRYFVFVGHQKDGTADIWAIREEEGFLRRVQREPIRLTAGPLSFSSPLPSTDGKKLFAVGEQSRGELVRYDKKIGQFLPYLSSISAHGVSFSADGKWIAYVTYPEGTLWRSRIDGTERLQLTFPPAVAYQPYWSPDGKTIAFMSAAIGKLWQVYTVSADGGTPTLVSPEGRNHSDPTWSPDGLSLAFGGLPFEVDNTAGIFILNLRTKEISKIPDSDQLFSPHWSPDGRYIAAQSLDALKQFLFDFKTHKWQELAAGGEVGYPNWSHDAKYLYYDSSAGNETGFYRIRISDHKIERITTLQDIHRASWLFGPWSGLAPDDSPLLLRDVSSQEVYALDLQSP